MPGAREPAEPDAITNPVAMVRVDDEERLILLGEGRELIEPRQIGGGK